MFRFSLSAYGQNCDSCSGEGKHRTGCPYRSVFNEAYENLIQPIVVKGNQDLNFAILEAKDGYRAVETKLLGNDLKTLWSKEYNSGANVPFFVQKKVARSSIMDAESNEKMAREFMELFNCELLGSRYWKLEGHETADWDMMIEEGDLHLTHLLKEHRNYGIKNIDHVTIQNQYGLSSTVRGTSDNTDPMLSKCYEWPGIHLQVVKKGYMGAKRCLHDLLLTTLFFKSMAKAERYICYIYLGWKLWKMAKERNQYEC